RDVGRRLATLVGDPRRHGDAFLVGEGRAGEVGRRHRQIGDTGGADRDRRERHPVGKVHVFGSGPSRFLKIGNQDRFFPLQRRARQNAFGEFQRRARAGRARRQFGGAQRGFEAAAIGGGADAFFGVAAEQHQRRPVGGAQRANRLARFV